MLEIINETKYTILSYDSEKSFLQFEWKPVLYVKDEDVMKELGLLFEIMRAKEPKYLLSHEYNRKFGYSPELQAQMVAFFSSSTQSNSSLNLKTAIVIPEDIIAQISLDQLGEESMSNSNDREDGEGWNMFETEEEALNFLFSQ